MAYVEGEPLSGFTLHLDGDTDAVEAIIKAAMKELGRQYEIAEREERSLFGGVLPTRQVHVLPPRRPVEGMLQVRTKVRAQ